MDILTAVILGIVEGISEFLPISSTGHLILTSHLIGLKHTDFLKSFEISIQVGAIMSVVVLYWRELLTNVEVMKRLIIAFLPTAIIGLTVYKLIKTHLLGSPYIVLWSLALGGLFLIIFEMRHREKKGAVARPEEITYKQALVIGIFQAIAMVPGVSRSAATIIGGLILGLKRKTIVEFSFLLAVPTMVAATCYDIIKSGASFLRDLDQLLALFVGLITSYIIATLSIRFLLKFIQSHTFVPFGLYRILLVIIWLIFLPV